jgi:hypothetical protein
MRRRRAQIALFEQLTGDFEETSKHGAEYHATMVQPSGHCHSSTKMFVCPHPSPPSKKDRAASDVARSLQSLPGGTNWFALHYCHPAHY